MTDLKPYGARTANEAPREEINRISNAMGRWRLLMGRRVIGRLAIGSVAPELELSHLDVIDAVRRAQREGEATVGAVADAMRIDPSRGSRLVADLVQKGVLRRAVSQSDARRAVVELTDRARRIGDEMQRIKRDMIESMVGDWPEEDVARFAELFSRFVDEFEGFARTKDLRPEGCVAQEAGAEPDKPAA